MTSLYLLLLVTQSFALQYTFSRNFGGKTDFSDKGWRVLIEQLSPEVRVGQPPTTEQNIAVEPTCPSEFLRCSTTYFGKDLALAQPDTAKLWVQWHQDATPFDCDEPEGCAVTSASSVADLTSQSDGWSVTASINAERGTNNIGPTINGNESYSLSYRDSGALITPKTLNSTKTLTSKCFQNHVCYMQTGTLMMTISGKCESQPVLVCDRRYFPCEELSHPKRNLCSQWAAFTRKHCQRQFCRPKIEECSLTVAVTRENGTPMSFQVFEQKPIPGKQSIAKLNSSSVENPFGELPDGSSGAWMAWSPQAK